MRKVLLVVFCMVAAVSVANAQSFSKYQGEAGPPGPPVGVPGPNSITQSTDTSTITQFNSVSCNAGNLHTDNSYLRRFALATDHGIVNEFTVSSLDWAIEQASSQGGSVQGGGSGQPVNVNLYSIPVGDPLTFGNLTPIGDTNLSIADQSQAGVNTAVSGTIADPTTTDLVVEVFTPNGQGAGNSFFIGSNPNGETAPSYLAAPDCGISEPTATGDIGVPDMHIIMVVNGDEAAPPAPTMGGWALIVLALVLLSMATWMLRRRPLHPTA